MMASSCIEFIGKVQSGAVSVEEETARALEEAERVSREFGCFITIAQEEALGRARELDRQIAAGGKLGALAGLPISVKDNICTRGIRTTAGSSMLHGYVPPFSATAVERIEAQGGIVIGKTSMDAFGFGTFSTNVGREFPIARNPHDKERSAGGSSGGSGAATAALKAPHVSLAESTGGSITAPASFCGVVGFTPTYGAVSRFGLIDYASSLDKIGMMARSVREAALLAQVIMGPDERDMTSQAAKAHDFSKLEPARKFKIGIPKELFEAVSDSRIGDEIWRRIKRAEAEGAEIAELSMPLLKYSVPSYYIIATAEASTNLAKYKGMIYGEQEKLEGSASQYFPHIRSAHFSDEEKRRILLGTFARTAGYRDRYYATALRAREMIRTEMLSALEKCNCLISPSMPILPPRFSDIEKLEPADIYAMDACTIPPDLACLPHLSLPCGTVEGLPVGMQITCAPMEERRLFEIGLGLEA